MIVDAKTADAIKKGDPITPGGWATFDTVGSVAGDMRQRAAITNQFKPATDGPFYVVEMEVTQPVKSNIGFVGRQAETTGGCCAVAVPRCNLMRPLRARIEIYF